MKFIALQISPFNRIRVKSEQICANNLRYLHHFAQDEEKQTIRQNWIRTPTYARRQRSLIPTQLSALLGINHGCCMRFAICSVSLWVVTAWNPPDQWSVSTSEPTYTNPMYAFYSVFPFPFSHPMNRTMKTRKKIGFSCKNISHSDIYACANYNMLIDSKPFGWHIDISFTIPFGSSVIPLFTISHIMLSVSWYWWLWSMSRPWLGHIILILYACGRLADALAYFLRNSVVGACVLAINTPAHAPGRILKLIGCLVFSCSSLSLFFM